MPLNGYIFLLPKEIKLLIGVFVIVLSIGFFSGLLFVGETSSANPNGIEEQYLGNEHDEDAEVMKFKSLTFCYLYPLPGRPFTHH